MNPKDSMVVEQVKPIAKMASKASEEVFHRVVAITRGISYQPHPTRNKIITITKAGLPALIVGIIIGRVRSAK